MMGNGEFRATFFDALTNKVRKWLPYPATILPLQVINTRKGVNKTTLSQIKTRYASMLLGARF
jgi:hypothetical protein